MNNKSWVRILLTGAAAIVTGWGCHSSTDAGKGDAASGVIDSGGASGLGGTVGRGGASGRGGAAGGGEASSLGGALGSGGASSSGSCAPATSDPTLAWVEKALKVGGDSRLYYQWLPKNYDANRRYQVLYEFHGCSDEAKPQDNHPPTQTLSGTEAIHIRMRAKEECWDLSKSGVEFTYFDAVVAAVESTLCADPSRRFATGYSSGAFMAHYLACWRGAMLRGVATIGGGYGPVPPTDCTGDVAALLIQDADDETVEPWKTISARDDHIERDGCNPNAPTTPFDPPPCQEYSGCRAGYPVVWCETSGVGHSSQPSLSAPAFWNFLSTLP